MSIAEEAERRRRLVTRTLPITVLGVGAFFAGIIFGAGSELEAVERFAAAWTRGDYEAMHAELTPEAQNDIPIEEFIAAYEEAAAAATIAEIEAGETEEGSVDGEEAGVVPVTARTRAWGDIEGEISVSVTDGLVAWEPHLVFPGLTAGESLGRQTRAPARAPILAADGTPLAEGPAAARSSPIGLAASDVTGAVDTARGETDAELQAQGFPPRSLTGDTGLELAFNDRLDGQPGGRLVALAEGTDDPATGRELAVSEPVPGKPVETTLDPDLQEAAVLALGDLFGGVAVLDAEDGSVKALAGIAFSAPQPPGSTFKVITTSAALEKGLVKPADAFPVETAAVIEGREVANAHDEACGGTFSQSFAKSCNSVFAPLGVEVGAEGLVAEAEAYGFNSPPSLYDTDALEAVKPAESTIPSAGEIGGDLDVGVSAIGQGEVLATPLQLASIAQTVAAGGTRSPTPIAKDPELAPDAKPVEVMSPETAKTLTELMIGVVTEGTGSAAALDGIQVAGKTGTAELGAKALEPGQELAPGEEPEQEVDAWFTAFAPASAPKLAVAAMVVNADGDGGTIAAPIVAQVLDAGL
ncbi:MAG: penicillin-binding transpeptidase domain-containing protein [Solirubrobacterales bacterium]